MNYKATITTLNCNKIFLEIGLICRLSGGKTSHLIDLNEPKILPCGINGCFKCIKKMCGFSRRMKCTYCCSEHSIKDVHALPTNNDLKVVFSATFVNLLNDLHASRIMMMRHDDREETIEKCAQYIEEEIEIRLESLKIQLDTAFETLEADITNIECLLLKKLNKFEKKVQKIARSQYNSSIYKAERRVVSIRNLNKQIMQLHDASLSNVHFIKSEKTPYPSKIGKLLYPMAVTKLLGSVLNQFYYEEPKIVNLCDIRIYKSCAICNIDNIHLALVNRENNLYILNRNFEILSTYEINNLYYMRNIASICSDQATENIYLTDTFNSQILIKNIHQNVLLKCFGSSGFSKYEFFNPCAICVYNNSFYVLDQGNKRIQVFSALDCVFQKVIVLTSSKTKRRELLESPISMSVTQNCIGVSDSINSIYFYDFDGVLKQCLFNLQYGVYSFLCISNYLFIHGCFGSLVCYDLKKILVSNETEQESEEVLPEFERFSREFENESTCMTYFNDNLVILFKNCNYLAIV